MAQHDVAHACLRWAFSRGHYAPRNIAVGDQANRFQVLDGFDYGNFAAVVPDHHLGCLLHAVFRRAAGKVGDHQVFAFQRMAKHC